MAISTYKSPNPSATSNNITILHITYKTRVPLPQQYLLTMSLFYVYMRWYKESDSRSGFWARQLLTCESRYVADEFFRALQTIKTADGRLRFTLLDRKTPQFWRYDTVDGDPWVTISNILCHGDLPTSIRGRVMSTLLHDGLDRFWPIAPVIPGRDWVNNGLYYIRNIRQPNIYWYVSGDGSIIASDAQKTQFRVRGTEFGKDEPKILIREDYIQLAIPPQPGSSKWEYPRPSNNLLISATESTDWKFKFRNLLENFGAIYKRDEVVGVVELVTWNDEGGQDQWELC